MDRLDQLFQQFLRERGRIPFASFVDEVRGLVAAKTGR
jgi:hypothetical protein